MRLSVSEVQVMCQRAAVGAGLPVGLGEDGAAAAAWLVTTGLDGVEVFRRALDGLMAGTAVAVTPEVHDHEHRLVPVDVRRHSSALYAGPAISDRILVHGEGSRIARLVLPTVDEPLLVFACAMITVRRTTAPVTIQRQGHGSQQGYQARNLDHAWSLWGETAESLDAPGPADVIVALGSRAEEPGLLRLLTAADIEDAARQCYDHGVGVTADAYEWLVFHGRKILVADSHQSRLAGAGAGLSDND